MLTWSDLEAHCAKGLIRRWALYENQSPKPEGRVLYMFPDVQEAIDKRPWPGSDGEVPNRTRERRSAMRMVLRRYMEGKSLVLRRDIKELGSPIDGQPNVNMRGFWEFRSQGRMEETRLFGFFARPGAFVATSFKGRGDFPAGDQSSWDAEKTLGEARWQSLFPTHSPLDKQWPVRTKADLTTYLEHSQ